MQVTEEMVGRFLTWKVPADFNPDCGISFAPVYNEKTPFGPSTHKPVGTNLLNAEQARAMLEHVLGAPEEAAPAGDVNMWAVHIQGPDDIYAAPDREVADAVALVLNMQFKRHPLADDVHMAASVVLWPYGYEAWSAAKDLLKLEVKGLSHDR